MSEAPFRIAWTPTAKRALSRLPEKVAAAAVEFIYGALAQNPHRVGKPLRRELEGLHNARRGDFRICLLYTSWAQVQLSQVTHADVQKWIASIERAPATVRKIHRVFSQILATAVRDGRIGRNVAEDISLPRVHATEKRFLSHAQVEDMAEIVGPDWQLLVRFLAYTGLRWGEVAALRVSRVDLVVRRRIS